MILLTRFYEGDFMQAYAQIILRNAKPTGNDSEKLAQCIVERIGLMPRKRGSNPLLHKTLVEFYERMKRASAQKDPKISVMTVDEMAIFAKISRQTMYEYLERWVQLELIQKVTYLESNGKVIIGYKLTASSLEDAFIKVKNNILANLEQTGKYIVELQKTLKNEKISSTMKQKEGEPTLMVTENA